MGREDVSKFSQQMASLERKVEDLTPPPSEGNRSRTPSGGIGAEKLLPPLVGAPGLLDDEASTWLRENELGELTAVLGTIASSMLDLKQITVEDIEAMPSVQIKTLTRRRLRERLSGLEGSKCEAPSSPAVRHRPMPAATRALHPFPPVLLLRSPAGCCKGRQDCSIPLPHD